MGINSLDEFESCGAPSIDGYLRRNLVVCFRRRCEHIFTDLFLQRDGRQSTCISDSVAVHAYVLSRICEFMLMPWLLALSAIVMLPYSSKVMLA